MKVFGSKQMWSQRRCSGILYSLSLANSSGLCADVTARTNFCQNLREVQSCLQRVPQRAEKSTDSNRFVASELRDLADGTLIGENIRERN
jgi:hypothetical protein